MKKITYIFFAFAMVFATSCGDYLDINEDPNRATSALPGPLFTGAVNNYSTNRVIDLGPALSTASQMWSGGGSLGAGVFTNPENYVFSVFTTGNTWRTYYRDMNKNLALAGIGAAEAGDNNAVAQTEIFQAFTIYCATVLWGDVPYSEALQVDFTVPVIENLNPAFDPQEEVLRGIVADLDAAIAKIDGGNSVSIGSADLIYQGNMENWRKFAKSLKFRTLMTMVDADPSVAGEISAMIAEGDMISSSAESAIHPFFDNPGNQNPFWGTLNVFAGGANFFYYANETMVNLMVSKNDPRVPVYFTPYPGGDSPADVTGAPAGVSNIGFNPWVLSTASPGTNQLVRPSSPDVLFPFSEQAYLEAEAIARGLASGGLAEADAKLRAGITAAMVSRGVDDGAIRDYLDNSIPDLTTVSPAEAVRLIAEEMYVDCVIRPIEGFTHWRRTEIPNLNPPAEARTGDILRRLPYPPDEVSANDNAPTNPPNLDVKMWFDL